MYYFDIGSLPFNKGECMKNLIVQFLILIGFSSTLNAAWTYDESAKTISDGKWVLNVEVVNGSLQLGKFNSVSSNAAVASRDASYTDLDFTSFYDDTNWRITAIKQNGFRGNTYITSFVAPDVVTVNSYSLAGLSSLTNMVLSQNVKTLAAYAFEKNSLMTNFYPQTMNNITIIKSAVFDSCTGLSETLSFPEATAVEKFAFRNCSNLKGVSVPNVTSIEPQSFRSCSGIVGDVEFPEVKFVGEQSFQYCNKITKFSFPNATTVGNNAFSSCAAVTNFYLPKSVSLGNNSFQDCKKLGDITLSADISSIGSSAFSTCSSLSNIFPRVFDSLSTVSQQCFYNCRSLKGTLSFPNVTVIGTSAFHSAAVEELILNDKITSFGQEAFRNCAFTNIVPQKFPKLSSSGANAFYNASKLVANFEFPLVEILRGFRGAEKLQSLKAPNALSIASEAFMDCASLKLVEFSASLTNISGNAFTDCTKLESITSYIPDTVYGFGASFYNCTSLKMPLRIANPSITTIGYECFRYTAAAFVGPVQIFSPIKTISTRAFQNNKTGQVYEFYSKTAPTSVDFSAFSVGPGNGLGKAGAQLHIMKQSALEGWLNLCPTKYSHEQMAKMPGYPGEKAIGVVQNNGYYQWIVNCAPGAGTLISIL